MTRSPRERAAQNAQAQREQERLFLDLLGILDDLDHASEHWRQAEHEHAQAPVPSTGPAAVNSESTRLNLLQQWGHRLRHWLGQSPQPTPIAETSENDESMTEVLTSAREGVEMIRRSLLEVLQQRQVVPLNAIGQPFDPDRMFALGRQESDVAEENSVVQEVVRGYLWRNRILREAKVMVAVKPTADLDPQG